MFRRLECEPEKPENTEWSTESLRNEFTGDTLHNAEAFLEVFKNRIETDKNALKLHSVQGNETVRGNTVDFIKDKHRR